MIAFITGISTSALTGNHQSIRFIEEQEDLKKLDMVTWSWGHYEKHYGRYCRIVQNFRCGDPYTAKTLVGEISKDWHPLGFARLQADDPCESGKSEKFCNPEVWKTEIVKNFGARVFLIRNLAIAELNGHMLIHFNAPKIQTIPFVAAVEGNEK